MQSEFDLPAFPLNECGQEHSHNGALMNGYTREITAHCGDRSLFLMVRPGDDLDDRFSAFDTDECEMISVAGWRVEIEEGH